MWAFERRPDLNGLHVCKGFAMSRQYTLGLPARQSLCLSSPDSQATHRYRAIGGSLCSNGGTHSKGRAAKSATSERRQELLLFRAQIIRTRLHRRRILGYGLLNLLRLSHHLLLWLRLRVD